MGDPVKTFEELTLEETIELMQDDPDKLHRLWLAKMLQDHGSEWMEEHAMELKGSWEFCRFYLSF